ncbi:hypothetical protein D8B26_004673 [Coccidioides posadasii str. Silveira]|uniref:uncharacterized protein n=1 Tax=Coccidioides posadasii (strain RMSCC 757 / Silveira) TaxID=443226 RepID=UPI001BF10039|nr:hypothetical protein D8B26_004673 [Coccidioides posadasii str. Silveira]
MDTLKKGWKEVPALSKVNRKFGGVGARDPQVPEQASKDLIGSLVGFDPSLSERIP